jgi:hypothetical protein
MVASRPPGPFGSAPSTEMLADRPARDPHAREPEAIDQVLIHNPGIAKLVWKDLRGDRPQGTGRRGLSAEQVLRAAPHGPPTPGSAAPQDSPLFRFRAP